MSDRIMRPVLKRANSVKQIGTVASTYATDRIYGAIDVADQYVDKYLPSEDATDSNPNHLFKTSVQILIKFLRSQFVIRQTPKI